MSDPEDNAPEDPVVDARIRYRHAELRLWATGNHSRDDPERIAAAREVLRVAFDILVSANREGSLSEAFAVVNNPTGKAVDKAAMGLGAEVLENFSRVFAARHDEASIGFRNGLHTLALNLFEVANGWTPSAGMIAAHDAPRGGQARSVRTLQAQKILVLTVHFISGRDGSSLGESFKMVRAHVTFETFKDWQKGLVPADARRHAKSAGRKTRQGARLNPDEAAVLEMVQDWTANSESLEKLAGLASGVAPAVPVWEGVDKPGI